MTLVPTNEYEQTHEQMSWKTWFKWLAILAVVGLLQYLIIKKIVAHRYRLRADEVNLPAITSPQVVTVWHADLGEAHLLFAPYFFDQHQQAFNDQALNRAIPGTPLTYYRLWLVNFTSTPLAFSDSQQPITLTLNNGQSSSNLSLSKLLPQVTEPVRPFLSTFCQSDPIPAGYLKEYIVAFAKPIATEAIQTVAIQWGEPKRALLRLTRLRSDLDEYLKHPDPAFGKQPTAQEGKK